jgi:hypothetical protein
MVSMLRPLPVQTILALVTRYVEGAFLALPELGVSVRLRRCYLYGASCLADDPLVSQWHDACQQTAEELRPRPEMVLAVSRAEEERLAPWGRRVRDGVQKLDAGLVGVQISIRRHTPPASFEFRPGTLKDLAGGIERIHSGCVGRVLELRAVERAATMRAAHDQFAVAALQPEAPVVDVDVSAEHVKVVLAEIAKPRYPNF